MIYGRPGPAEPIEQADIIDGCPLYALRPTGGQVDFAKEPLRVVQRVFVLTQACDLVQRKCDNVTVAVVHSAALVVERGLLKAQAIRDHVRRGLVHGWYFLPAGADPTALPECVIDMRDVHTVSRLVLEHLVAEGKRPGRVVTPFREHLASHFGATYARIGLPEPYETAD